MFGGVLSWAMVGRGLPELLTILACGVWVGFSVSGFVQNELEITQLISQIQPIDASTSFVSSDR